ncbi:MAG: hypothetical protein KDA80_24340 [Planctomycetaceae bacterium]|nr:hypothetical protein [Planctomycetaceae bacterium]
MEEQPPGSITVMISDLKAGEATATELLWQQYFQRLVRLADRKLMGAPQRVADAEDIALSVMNCLFVKAEAGEFEQLTDREDLWKLLVILTKQKAIDLRKHQSRQKRGGGEVRGESIFLTPNNSAGGIDAYFGDTPTPEFLASLEEEWNRLLKDLPDDTFRRIAQLKLQSHTDQQIATELGIAVSTVERKLRRIRSNWLSLADEFN